jgi:hypothetical protein
MIRPVTGAPLKTSAVSDIQDSQSGKLNIWPNPVKDFLNLELADIGFSGEISFAIYDLQGKIVKKELYSEKIDVSTLKEGYYIIILYSDSKPLKINRFIKTF